MTKEYKEKLLEAIQTVCDYSYTRYELQVLLDELRADVECEEVEE